MRAAVREGRERGYAYLDGPVFPGTAAVGVAFPASAPVAALSVAAISARLDEVRRAEVGALLRQQAQRLSGVLEKALAGV